MTKFFTKSIIFFIILFTIILGLNYRWTNTEVYLLKGERYRFINNVRKIDICNLGSSHGICSFDYTNTIEGVEGANLGRPVQNFYYDLQVLKANRLKLHKGSVVFIPISYFSYYEYMDEPSFIDVEDAYYGILPLWYQREPSLSKTMQYKWLPILYIQKNEIKYLFKDKIGLIEEYNQVFMTNKLINKETGLLDPDSMDREVEKTRALHTANIHRGYSDIAINKLKEILTYCEQRDYQPILITTPISQQYSTIEEYSKSFLSDFYAMTDSIATEYDLPYWDYSTDIRFWDNYELFLDDDHLNNIGRIHFSEIVINRAIQEGYLETE